MDISEKPTGNGVGYLELLRENANFRYLWIGQIVSLLGDWFNLIASASLIAVLTDSGLAIGGLFVVRMLAQFAASPVGGVLADRYNRRNLLVASDLLRAAVVLGFFLVREPRHVPLLYTLTALQLALSGIFNPTRDALLPDILVRKEIGPANALSSATWSTMLAFGAALGGVVAGEWGIQPAFAIDSLTFLLSAVVILRIRLPEKPRSGIQDAGIGAPFRAYWAGLVYIWGRRDVFVLTLQKSAVALGVSSVFPIIMVSLSSEVYVVGEGGSTGLGLFYAMVGVGTGIGPIAARSLTGDRELSLRRAILWGFAVAAAGLLTVSAMAGFWAALLGTLLRGVGAGVVWVFSTQLLLVKVPGQVRGRVFGTEFAMFTLMNALGAAAGGALLDQPAFGIPSVLWILAAMTSAAGLAWVWAGGLKVSPTLYEEAVEDRTD